MSKRKKFFLGNISVTIGVIMLLVFGSFMIVSAEMGNAAGDSKYLTSVLLKQLVYAFAGIIAYYYTSKTRIVRMRIQVYWIVYSVILVALIACRVFGATNGAYAWIPIGSFASIQPSEFAKAFMLVFAARLLDRNRPKDNLNNFRTFAICAAIYFVVILGWQKDLGSAMVLAVMCYCMLLIPSYKEFGKYQKYMLMVMLAVLFIGIPLILSPLATSVFKHFSSNYMAGRFIAAADPFLYRYDSGYHVVMSLVSFANGNLIGLGYSNSIHKYMNFPNPSNDFILPVIVEELGIIGFGIILLGYCLILLPIIRFSTRSEKMSTKIIGIGVVAYMLSHFIFNVGGVSGFIPLTGVPLLMISSGGSSLIGCMMAIGIIQNEFKTYYEEEYENNSGQV